MSLAKLQGWALTLDGCPYVFSTQGISTLPTPTADGTPTLPGGVGDWPKIVVSPGNATLAQGVLAVPQGSWTERSDQIEGDAQSDSMSFTLFDPVATSGPASGSHLLTWLGTTNRTMLAQTFITANVLSTDFTITVNDATQLPAAPCMVYLDGEAILISSIAANVLSVYVNVISGKNGRGCFGSRAVAHTQDTLHNKNPIVFGRYPGFERSRAILWWVDTANNATPIWRGTCVRAPRFTEEDRERGAIFELQCDGIWLTEKQRKAAVPTVAITFHGYDLNAVRVAVGRDPGPHPDALTHIVEGHSPYPGRTAWASTVAEAIGMVSQNVNAWLQSPPISSSGATSFDADGHHTSTRGQLGVSGYELYVTDDSYTLHASYGTDRDLLEPTRFTSDAVTSTETSAPYSLRLPIAPLNGPYLARFNLDSTNTLNVSTTQGLTAAPWTTSTVTYNGFVTTVEPALVGDVNDNLRLVITGATSFAGTTTNPQILGARITPVPITSQAESYEWGTATRICALYTNVLFKMSARVTSQHWLLAIRDGLLGDPSGSLASGADPRNFDWTQLDSIIGSTSGGGAQRIYDLDGEKAIGEFWIDNNKFYACGIGVLKSRICPFKFRAPTAADTATLTITAVNVVTNADWRRLEDGLANVVNIKSGSLTVSVRDQVSIGMFGVGRTIELNLPGTDELLAYEDLTSLWPVALSQIIAYWGYPGYGATFRLSLQYINDIGVGQFLKVTDWLVPDGSGGRSITAKMGQVISRHVSLAAKGFVELDVVFYDFNRLGAIAPCVRVASVANSGPGGVGVITVATNYVNGAGTVSTNDYSNSTSTGYSGTANDGGVSLIHAGDVIQFISRNNVTQYTDGPYTVASTNPGAGTITLTAAIAAGTIAYGGTLDVISTGYGNGSAPTAYQKNYAYVGNRSTGVIGTSTDAPNTYAP